ncbi:MAG: hypothetical protein KDD47_25590 [Acidobacteria bacterium]|nr:hypothetical protein [Acidobacteriota bacterium]
MATDTRSLIYVRSSGGTLGPFTPDIAVEETRQQRLSVRDPAAWAGSATWKPLGELLKEVPVGSRAEPQKAPVHPLSAILLIAVDFLWTGPEALLTASAVGIPALLLTSLAAFGVTFFAVSRVQSGLAGEEPKAASAKGIGLGVLAGLPYPIFGTVAGTCFLAWSGIRKLLT